MKRNLLIAIKLTIICIIAGLALSGLNEITSPIIADNETKTETKLCQKIFSNYDEDNSTFVEDVTEDIDKKITVHDSANTFVGYIYRVSGRNSFGEIVLLVGIDSENKLVSVEFLTNGQTMPKEVENHVSDSYTEGLANTSAIDTSCGATYGAKLVKSLVDIAFADATEGGTN